MLKKAARLLAVLMLLLLAAGCDNNAGAQSGAPYYSFTDDAGVVITLKSRPKKTAVLFSSYADAYVGAGGNVFITVGESVERGIMPADTRLVDGGAGKTIDTEALIAYEPDFVICSADIAAQAKAAKLLNSVGIPAAQFHVESFDNYLNMLKILTDITGNSKAYTDNGLNVKENIDKIIESANGTPQKRILFIRSGSGYSSAKAKRAGDHFACQMLDELGAYNIADNAPVLLDGLSIEHILEQNPDYIFITTMGDESAARAYMDSVLQQKAWQQLDAVKNQNYSYLPKDLFQFKPNSRWDEAYEYLWNILNGDSKS